MVYADCLGAAPFGEGGAKVLSEKYGYDKMKSSAEVAKAIGLSNTVIHEINYNKPGEIDTTQGQILHVVNILIKNLPALIPDMIKEISKDVISRSSVSRVNCTMSLYKILTENPDFTSEEKDKIAVQEAQTLDAIAYAERLGIKNENMLSYLLSREEASLIQKKPADYNEPFEW
jgi:hypothetical protein